jgi:phenylacetate-CoA ligase
LSKTQWYKPEQLREIQLSLLKKVVAHAYRTVPYWRGKMDVLGIHPQDIRELEDIRRFPIISKKDLKEIGDGIVSCRYPQFLLNTAHTGGTTGLPVPLRRDLFSIGNEHAFVRRQFDWASVGRRDSVAYMMGRVVASPSEKLHKPYVYDASMKELTLSAFHLSPDVVPTFVDAMRCYGVKVLVAYPSAASVLGRGCLQKGIRLPLKCVLTTAETLDDGKRQVISEAFDCPVFDFYGSAERVCYIHTCEHGRYHILPEYGLTELERADPPNEDCCQIIATGFWNMAMPLIRYKMGDLVLPSDEECPCGRHFPMIARIVGRESDAMVTPSGRRLGATAIECLLAHVLYGMYEMPVLAGQVIQESASDVVLEYVPAEGFSEKHAQQLRELLERELPDEFNLSIRPTRQINQTPSGKFLSFVMAEHH